MPSATKAALEPRKSPVQARSTASVDAILKATIQVLLKVGKERLTTTRVADRAGVSVGTLYQYFPNKTALLRAVLKQHMDHVMQNVERVCIENRGRGLEQMANALVSSFLEAKLREVKTSVALYSISSDVDGMKVVQETSLRSHKAIVEMLRSSSDQLSADPQLIATMLQGVMAGVSRRLLESPAPEKQYEPLKQELVFLAISYLKACSTRGIG